MVQKAVNVEVKANLRSSTMIWDLDTHCFRGYRPSHNTSLKVQTQGSKDLSHSKETKLKDPKSVSSYNNTAKSPKKDDRKDKKKKF